MKTMKKMAALIAVAGVVLVAARSATGAAIPFEETQASQQGGGHQIWPIPGNPMPSNPEGGEQFIALGQGNWMTPEGGPTGSGGDNLIPLTAVHTRGGFMTLKLQYCPGYENDAWYLQGRVVAVQGGVTGPWSSLMGVGTRTIDGETGPNTGPWAPILYAFDEDGNGVFNTGWFAALGLSYDGMGGDPPIEGFYNLPMETWYEITVTADLDPNSTNHNRITEFTTRNLTSGVTYTMDMPLGPSGEELYVGGGTNSAVIPDAIICYNIGRGTISCFDNVGIDEDILDFERPTFIGAHEASGSLAPAVYGTAPTALVDDYSDQPGQGGAIELRHTPEYYGVYGNNFDVFTYAAPAPTRLFARAEVKSGQTLAGILEATDVVGSGVTYDVNPYMYDDWLFEISGNELHLKEAPAEEDVGKEYFVEVTATGASSDSMLIKVTVVSGAPKGMIFMLRALKPIAPLE